MKANALYVLQAQQSFAYFQEQWIFLCNRNLTSAPWAGMVAWWVGCWVRCKKMARGKSIDNITNTFFVFDHTPSWNESKCKFIYDIHQVCHSFGIYFASFQAHSGFAYHTSLTWNAIKVKRKTLSDKCHFSRILFVVTILQIYNMTASFHFMQDYRGRSFRQVNPKKEEKRSELPDIISIIEVIQWLLR